jgi:hypothetical protein
MKRFHLVAGAMALLAFAACESLPVAPIVEEGDYPDASSDGAVDARGDAPSDAAPDTALPADASPDVALVTDATTPDADAGSLDAAADVADADAAD